MMDLIKEYAGWIVATAAAAAALLALLRWLYKRVVRVYERVNDSVDALIGREEIRHPDTGRVLAPATPGLGKRLADMEATLDKLATADDRLSRLERWKDEHTADVIRREEARSNEAIAMWNAIEAVARAGAIELDPLPKVTREVSHEVREVRRVRTGGFLDPDRPVPDAREAETEARPRREEGDHRKEVGGRAEGQGQGKGEGEL